MQSEPAPDQEDEDDVDGDDGGEGEDVAEGEAGDEDIFAAGEKMRR